VSPARLALLLAALVTQACAQLQPHEETPSHAALTAAAEPGAGVSAPVPAPEVSETPAAPEAPDPDSIDEAWLLEDDFGPDPAERDNIPRWNRGVFAFNEGLIRWVLDPITRGYQAVTPKFLREMIHRGFENLDSPAILANDLLQLDPCRAGRTLGRFALNSTAGMLGLVDVAAEMGLERRDNDFGETLGRYGVRSGSYFVIPVLGPSTARDTTGELVDLALRPEIWLLGGIPSLAVTGTDGLSTYDIEAERLAALRDTSVDFYAALRSAYLMDRDARIQASRDAGRCGLGRKRDAELAE
jgi:phospholipid-binding lipoprotein MlaA